MIALRKLEITDEIPQTMVSVCFLFIIAYNAKMCYINAIKSAKDNPIVM